MLPMDRVEITAFRFLGGLGSCFTMFQSIIWLALSLTGVACKYFELGSYNDKRSFGYCFYLLYGYNESDHNITRLNFINPSYFNIMMLTSTAMCSVNLIISAIMLAAFLKWINALLVKRIAVVWAICIILLSIMECVMCAFFIYDIIVIVRNDESKCFKKADITYFRATYEPGPAPYLHNLKLKLLKLKKKIKRFKKKLYFLDIVVDDNDPNYIDNPFISKKLLNNHVKEVWREMFNNNIYEPISEKSNYLPHDEIMKKFLINKDIFLDETDESLLKYFDRLTNIKWVKPVESSNVAIGRKFNLDPEINLENEDINKTAILLHEYLKNEHQQPDELIEADKILDNATKAYLENLYLQMQNLYFKDMKTKFKNVTKEVAQRALTTLNNLKEEDEILPYLKQFFNGLLSLGKVDDNLDENLFQSLMDNITQLFEKNREKIKIDDGQKMSNIKEYLFRNLLQNNTETTQTTEEASTTKYSGKKSSNELINELCENCSFFVLWPGIVCMLLSLKTGFVWFLNIILASLVLHYGDKIEIRRKTRISCIIKYE